MKVCLILSFIFGFISLAYGALSPQEVRELESEIKSLIAEKNCAPILIRLAWHDSGTYDGSSHSGGSRGSMRFKDGESTHGANAGLSIAQSLLEGIGDKWCDGKNTNNLGRISIADLWCFAGTIAIEVSGGPRIAFKFGRVDAQSSDECVESGRLPDGDKGLTHLRDIFFRMGFNDRDIVALSGAHTLGSCHSDRSGFDGPWTSEPYKFDNQYYKDIINKKWVETTVKATGNPQLHTDPDDGTMMLRSDIALYEEKATKHMVEEYAQSQETFFKDFAKAWQKLVQLGYNDDQLYTVNTGKTEL